jgi:serine phosphatase RsbU (regulator of sigma subunit)/DNA-binding response OmpR family regulator/anti-sigma regulatory factor (Ser/Thr protein kinase)
MAAALSRRASSQSEPPLAFSGLPRSFAREDGAAPANVLIVDDDPQSLRALRALLEPLGQRLVLARSGEEALRCLLQDEFAVILLDMRMPGLDGVETARYIHARSRTRHVPIVFLTAQPEDVEQMSGAYAAGAVDYVVKPFDPELLRSKVAVFVELHRARAEHVREARARAEAEAVASTVGKLQSISDAALAHLEMDELLPEILRRASTVFSVDAAGLVLSGDENAEMSLVLCHGQQCSSEALSRSSAERMFGPVLEGSALNVSDLGTSKAFGGLAARELRSLIAAPLSIGRSALGVLFLSSSEAQRFSDEDMVVLRLSAERAAIAVEHARSYERERGLVESLQRHFLPDSLPQVPGLEMAARYQPSERAAQVGGDWYDVIALPDGRVGLAIGDVVGHGIGAATLMGELRTALRAYLVRDPGAPAKALASLNSLAAITYGGMVATLSYMVVDVEHPTILFASAGHPPPILLSPDGSTTVLEHTPASPLGTAEASEFSDWEGELPAGSTVLLYTDGLVERRGEPIDAGLARLRESLREAPEDLERLCSHLLARAPSAAVTLDDVALLAVRRAPVASEHLDLELAAEPASLTVARHRLERWLADAGASEDDQFAIRLAVNEACTNAVEHAYGPERGPTYRLLARHSAGQLLVEVSDSGSWRAPRGRHRGLGLQMMEHVMDALEIEQDLRGTTIRMRKRIARA